MERMKLYQTEIRSKTNVGAQYSDAYSVIYKRKLRQNWNVEFGQIIQFVSKTFAYKIFVVLFVFVVVVFFVVCCCFLFENRVL